MEIKIDRTGDPGKLKELILELSALQEVSSVMVLVCEKNGLSPANFDAFLKKSAKPVFGGIFPGILTENELLYHGSIVAGLTHPIDTLILENISHDSTSFDKLFVQPFEGKPVVDKTTFLFIDGMSKTIAPLLDATFNHFGLNSNYIGGGAGSADFIPMPCVITPRGILQDAAIFAFTDTLSGVGVAHGWHPVSEVMKITESSYNAVKTINWKPAREVYLDTIARVSGLSADALAFDDIAGSYPIGIVKMADELLVRDPVRNIEQSMVCLGELPVNSFIYVLKGDIDSLLSGTSKSRLMAERIYKENLEHHKHEASTVTFFIDCITRANFLGSRFCEELKIASGGQSLIGALSLGEIANSGHDYLEFYNKTAVVGIFEG